METHLFVIYTHLGGYVTGILVGMILIHGQQITVKRIFFVVGALLGWPFYLPYIYNNIYNKDV